MRSLFTRLAAIAIAVVVVVSCDTRLTDPGTDGGGGNTGGGGSSGTGLGPNIVINKAQSDSVLRPGDSIRVAATISDPTGVKSVTFSGAAVGGDSALGTLHLVQVFAAQTWSSGDLNFPANNTNFVMTRLLPPVLPFDSTIAKVTVWVKATNAAGIPDSASLVVPVTYRPKVTFLQPIAGTSVTRGSYLPVRIVGSGNTTLDSLTVAASGATSLTVRDTLTGKRIDTLSTRIWIPDTVTVPSTLTLTAAVRAGSSGADTARMTVQVLASAVTPPLVYQDVGPRLERTGTIGIRLAQGSGIDTIGILIRDSTGRLDTLYQAVTPPTAAMDSLVFHLDSLDPSWQGRTVSIRAFAKDNQGRYGYAVASTVTVADTVADISRYSTQSLIVFGSTYALPTTTTTGVAGDIAVNQALGQVFVSRPTGNRLELWRADSSRFDTRGVPVGSQPWGLAISATDPSVLLVANSGGTNISRVVINDPANIHEDLATRMLTRPTALFTGTEDVDNTTLVVHDHVSGPVTYSDRPQYIGQLVNGLIYYSTRPTTVAPLGTVRWIDPTQAYPDPQQVIFYKAKASNNTFVVANSDSVISYQRDGGKISDSVIVCDHPAGTNLAATCGQSTNGINDAIANLRSLVPTSDAYAVWGVDISGAGLTDTTWVAVSGDHRRIAFGEGNSGPGSELIMALEDGSLSPQMNVSDLENNASDQIFGVALDSTGTMIAAHGTQSFFSAVDYPFHLRLQGVYSSATSGAGIAFHPAARGTASPDSERVAFVAVNNGTIEIVDAAYFINRGLIPIKGKPYGPLRVSRRFPNDPPDVVLKLFALTDQGLLVINLRSSDIRPVQ